jgi:hypothetical protein
MHEETLNRSQRDMTAEGHIVQERLDSYGLTIAPQKRVTFDTEAQDLNLKLSLL